ncbi:MAG: cytochrome P450, partial [Actinophytocola sp.]
MADLPVFPFDSPPELDADPRHAELRQRDPVPRVRLAGGGQVRLVTRYEDVKRVYADPVFSRAEAAKPDVPTVLPGPGNPYLLLSMDPPAHTRMRKLVARAFTRRAVERMGPRLQELADELVDAMVAHGPPVDFIDAFAAPLPATVISEFIGAPGDDQRQLRQWMDIMLSITAHSQDEIRAA